MKPIFVRLLTDFLQSEVDALMKPGAALLRAVAASLKPKEAFATSKEFEIAPPGACVARTLSHSF